MRLLFLGSGFLAWCLPEIPYRQTSTRTFPEKVEIHILVTFYREKQHFGAKSSDCKIDVLAHVGGRMNRFTRGIVLLALVSTRVGTSCSFYQHITLSFNLVGWLLTVESPLYGDSQKDWPM